MAELFMERDQLSEAESSLNHALRLHMQIQNVLGRANDMQDLGVLYMRRNQLAEAEVSLVGAVELHRQAGDVMGWANDMQKLGELNIQTGDLDEAEKAFSSAVKLHQRACNQAGEAKGLQSLVKLRTQREQPWAARGALVRELKPRSSSTGALDERDIGVRLRDLDLICRLEGSESSMSLSE
jgi:tetratricopeptide (TPR) repeat protein